MGWGWLVEMCFVCLLVVRTSLCVCDRCEDCIIGWAGRVSMCVKCECGDGEGGDESTQHQPSVSKGATTDIRLDERTAAAAATTQQNVADLCCRIHVSPVSASFSSLF